MHDRSSIRPFLFCFQICAAFAGAAAFVWKMADFLKLKLYGNLFAGVKPWILPYYHPFESALLNYILTCVVLALAVAAIYLMAGKLSSWSSSRLASVDERVLIAFSVLSVALLTRTALKFDSPKAIAPAAILTAIPLFQFLPLALYGRVIRVSIGILILAICVEPARLALGPVLLMNEYPDLPEATKIGAVFMDNQEFLSSLPAVEREVKDRLGTQARLKDLPALRLDVLESWGGRLAAAGSAVDLDRLLDIRTFTEDNSLEYTHQIMGRGQINHIGHVLAPINEYEAGKPLKEIYMQYGLGNTFLFKWTMALFGGLSLHNYYKVYLFYILYYLLFLGMLVVLFRRPVYVFCGLSALALMHYSYSYIGLVLAPGIIPTIHLLDVPMVLLLWALFSAGDPFRAEFLSALVVSAAILLNRQFGGMLAAAWSVSLAVYALECRSGFKRYRSLLLPPLVILASLFFVRGLGSGSGTEGALAAYFSGFFSWAPMKAVVIGTLLYLSVSYILLLSLAQVRLPEKYLYIFTFAYVQGLFVYFYWSGLLNHLPLVFPFVALQALLAARMAESGYPARPAGRIIALLKPAVIIALFLSVSYAAFDFYLGPMGKSVFEANFASHKTYSWDLDRAHVLSTTDPSPISEAVSLIGRYAPRGGIVMLSRYDSLLAVLSGRYSLLSFFEMPWFITSELRAGESVEKLKTLAAEYIFVDSDMEAAAPGRYSILYDSPFIAAESSSRSGRLAELRKLYGSVAKDYRLVERGRLVSVYRRIERKR